MRNGDMTKSKPALFGAAGIRDILRQYLPYAGIPFVMATLLVVFMARLDAFVLLNYELLIVFGYITAIFDIKTRRIPNALILAMLMAWAIAITPRLFLSTDAAIAFLLDSAIGFVVGGGLFLLIYLVSRKGLGGGDVKFMAGVGLYLGFGKVIPAMFYATILAALVGLTLILMKKIGRKDKIPLAPFLYIGILIAIFLH